MSVGLLVTRHYPEESSLRNAGTPYRKEPRSNWHTWIRFLSCCLTIWLIGALDTWLVIKYADSIGDMEKNPVCLFLINLDPQRLSLFIAGKAFGLSIVICSLFFLFAFWKKLAMTVTYAITLFQLGLLSYLFVLSDIPHYCLVWSR